MKTDEQMSMRVESLPGLREQVAERIRMAIATGRFLPGARLIERELCEMMGVSRTSLREALRELQADGLVISQPNKGLSVSVVTLEDAESVYEVRAALEGLAARLFARRASEGQLAALKKSVDRLASVCANFSAEDFIKAKSEFYDIFLEGGCNEVTAELLRRLHTRVSQLRIVSLSSSEWAEKSTKDLRKILDALQAGDEEKASQLCVEHVEHAADAALKVLRASSGATSNT